MLQGSQMVREVLGYILQKNSKYQLGYQLKYEFTIALHKKDQALLENIKLSFNNVGGIHKHGEQSVHYRVSSMKDISIILNHFDNYPLRFHVFNIYINIYKINI
jgi:hypothetical protein